MKTFLMICLGILLSLGIIMQAGSGVAQDQSGKFPHKSHVEDEEIACLDCHSSAETSLSGSDNLLPAFEVCSDCHDPGEVPDPGKMNPVTAYSEKFAHAKHLQAGQKCADCHGNITEDLPRAMYSLPTMVGCMDCHEQKRVSTDCAVCHTELENLRPISHAADFMHNHADLARLEINAISGGKNCQTCHKVEYCQDCHEGENLDRLTHPLNYEFTHSLNALGKERECAACHTERQFCVDCHADNQVLPYNHTAGWANRIPNDGGRHRLEAQNDLDYCMSCHEQDAEQVCQKCHG